MAQLKTMSMKKLITLFFLSFGSLAYSQGLVKNINPAGDGNPYLFLEYNGAMYFSADDGTGGEVWKSDGTPSGTVMLKDINPSGTSDPDNTRFIVYNNELYFTADDGTNGKEVWKSNGTSA